MKLLGFLAAPVLKKLEINVVTEGKWVKVPIKMIAGITNNQP